MDAYEIYTQWWKDYYGYECPITREAWKQWCAQAHHLSETNRTETQFDVDTERREGWGYDDV